MTKPKKLTQADFKRKFGDEVCSYFVVESALRPGELQINQYASRLIGPLTPAKARELAANLVAGADAVEAEAAAAEAVDLVEIDAPTLFCSRCNGVMYALGMLGSIMHYRCRHCGGEESA